MGGYTFPNWGQSTTFPGGLLPPGRERYYLQVGGGVLPPGGVLPLGRGYYLPRWGYYFPRHGWYYLQGGYYLPRWGYYLQAGGTTFPGREVLPSQVGGTTSRWGGTTFPGEGVLPSQAGGWYYLQVEGITFPGGGGGHPLPEQHSVYLLRGRQYASCVHAGGLSCWL